MNSRFDGDDRAGIRQAVWTAKLAEFGRQYERLIQMVDQRVPILVHGYDYFVPSGKGVRLDGFEVTQPPFHNAMNAAGILGEDAQNKAAARLVDDFNELLADLARTHARSQFWYCDLRGTVAPKEWANEMHPRSSGFGKIAQKLFDVLTTRGVL